MTEKREINVKKSNKLIIVMIILVIVAILGFWGYRHYFGQSSIRAAVFMTNGQVYFGYLRNMNDSMITLNDVYYLKTADLQNNANSKILLVKMGNELHGPQSNMTINREQILFWQFLRSDSKINDAIARFNSGQASPTPAPSTTPSPTSS